MGFKNRSENARIQDAKQDVPRRRSGYGHIRPQPGSVQCAGLLAGHRSPPSNGTADRRLGGTNGDARGALERYKGGTRAARAVARMTCESDLGAVQGRRCEGWHEGSTISPRTPKPTHIRLLQPPDRVLRLLHLDLVQFCSQSVSVRERCGVLGCFEAFWGILGGKV